MQAPLIASKFAVTEIPQQSFVQDIAKYIDYNFLVAQAGQKQVNDVMYLDTMRTGDVPFLRQSMYKRDSTIMSMFERDKNVVKSKGKERIRWNMELPNSDLRATFVKNVELDPAFKAGLRGTPFDILISSNDFVANDVIIFDGYNDMPLIIRSAAMPEGIGFRYEVRLLEDAPGLFFELDKLDAGTHITQIGSFIGEATMTRGSIHLNSGAGFMEFETSFTRMGWELEVTDKAQRATKNYMFYDKDSISQGANGKTRIVPAALTNDLEAIFQEQIQEQIDFYLAYGKQSSRVSPIVDGVTGRVLEHGSGFFEFLNTSYVHEYNPSVDSLDVITDAIASLWNNTIPVEQRVVKVMGGSGARKIWAKWMREKGAFPIATRNDGMDYYINSASPTLETQGRKAFAANAAVVSKYFLDGEGTIEFQYASWMDNDKQHGRKFNGEAALSYEFIVTEYGFGNGMDSNVYIVEDDDYDQMGYITGTWTPYGAAGKAGNLSGRFIHDGSLNNKYKLYAEKGFGFVVKDPSKMMWFKPNV